MVANAGSIPLLEDSEKTTEGSTSVIDKRHLDGDVF